MALTWADSIWVTGLGNHQAESKPGMGERCKVVIVGPTGAGKTTFSVYAGSGEFKEEGIDVFGVAVVEYILGSGRAKLRLMLHDPAVGETYA